MSKRPDIVVGSGPAGIAAAHALLARGRAVLLVDGGRSLEDAAVARSAALAARDPSDWAASDRAGWMAPQFDTPPGQVRRFGSDFAMEPAEATFAAPAEWMELRASRAAGGLSNLWGAAVLPYAAKDMAGWPIGADDLAPHYRAVAALMPVAGSPDDLQALYPTLPMAGRAAIAPSPQARRLLGRLARHRTALADLGVTAGAARQAVGADCRLCGLCLHGCPYGLIWSARHALAALHGKPGFTYRPGAVVTRFVETPEGVTLHLASGGTIAGGRAFLGAGVLETARILLASRAVAGELVLRDSQHAFLPMIERRLGGPRPDLGAFHTLPQAFVAIDAPEVSPHLVHAQLYGWNEFYPRDLVARYGDRIPLVGAPLMTALARRLVVAQLFLHSDHSHRIALGLAPDGRLTLRLDANPAVASVLRAATARMGRAMRFGGLLPLGFASRPGAPGSSFHCGATVPMAQAPGPGQSDRLGRPQGLSRVHLVDASSLPAIPATTITFSVMANAHRIAASAD
ncbi:MAG: GMC family oxidoreductase [Defluviimonas sp.]|uniref:FAD-binding protein n=1 Tax=Albidovulum sp. TaxID=1872424 RepID=UPI002A2A972B|nr:GMC family oxidoreductase [Defluviimonas sp.]